MIGGGPSCAHNSRRTTAVHHSGARRGVCPTVSPMAPDASRAAAVDIPALLASFRAVGGECGPPLPEAEIEALSAPPELKALLRAAREWHICPDHCGVFGLNLFDTAGVAKPWVDKVQLIGDEEMVTEWAEEHGLPNCAQGGWECFAAVSEFDYIFVCTAVGQQHGATRRMVNK